MASFARELEVALEAIRAAGAEVLRLYASFEQIADAPADISTEADRTSQEMILGQLSRAFPTDGLCGEESTPTLERASQAVSGGSGWWIRSTAPVASPAKTTSSRS